MRKYVVLSFVVLFVLGSACGGGGEVNEVSDSEDPAPAESERDKEREDEIRAALASAGASTPLSSEVECLAMELPDDADLEAIGGAFGPDVSSAEPVVADEELVAIFDECIALDPMSTAFVNGLATGLEVTFSEEETSCMSDAIEGSLSGAGEFLQVAVSQEFSEEFRSGMGECADSETVEEILGNILVGSAGLSTDQASCVTSAISEDYTSSEAFADLLDADSTLNSDIEGYASVCI